jgi:hypothetical protein
MNTLTAFSIIALAGLIHASFQLSVSMLTLLSSHTIGRKRSQARLVVLTNSFVFGAAVMTTLLLCLFAQLFQAVSGKLTLDLLWTAVCGGTVGLAVAVLLFYYRKQAGTTLWLPRQMARYLATRAKATKHSAEAFTLGLASVLGELVFICMPLVIAALVLIQLDPVTQLAGIGFYVAVSLSSLVIMHALIGSGHRISSLQRWREQNKRFFQLSAGSGLLVLGFYLYVEQVMTVAVWAAEKAVW